MSNPKIFQFQTTRLLTTPFLARMRLPSGILAVIASFLKITATVYGKDNAIIFTDDLDPSDVMFDSLQGTIPDPDPRWPPEYTEPQGYNFLWICPGSSFPDASWYRVEVIFYWWDVTAQPPETEADKQVYGAAIYEGAALSTGPYT